MIFFFATLSLLILLWGLKQQNRKKAIESDNKRLYQIIKYYRESNSSLMKMVRNAKPDLRTINNN